MAAPIPLSTAPDLVAPLCALLDQMDALLGVLDERDYAEAREAFMGASVGQHVRHCLDHVGRLMDAVEGGLADYDARRRGTPVETDPRAARAAIAQLRLSLSAIDGPRLRRRVRVRAKTSADGQAVECESRVDRELVFVMSHTVHHHALIRAMVESRGLALPAGFGYAPSTMAHRKAVDACVR